uniref:8.9 kDa family member n=1 Tax=Rhipicephalus zambeziensis TaxID=60191 RepID=A0A224Y3J2_9ACAR
MEGLQCMFCTFLIFLTKLLFDSGSLGSLTIEKVDVQNNSCVFRNHTIRNGQYGRPSNHCVHALCMARARQVVYQNCSPPEEYTPGDQKCIIYQNMSFRFPYCCPKTVCSKS